MLISLFHEKRTKLLVLPCCNLQSYQSLPLYSKNKTCSMFLDLNLLKECDVVDKHGMFACPTCTTIMCANCKSHNHAPLTCTNFMALPESERDPGNLALLELSKQEGYSHCNKCQTFVQLEQGCNHITCVCGHQFCYPCRQQWKTCRCDQWDENLLLAAGRERVGNAAPAAEVRRAMQRIRREEECGAHTWQRVERGGQECRNCTFYMYRYLYRCQICRFDVCHTCRFHRL
jgi:hypothetical protein